MIRMIKNKSIFYTIFPIFIKKYFIFIYKSNNRKNSKKKKKIEFSSIICYFMACTSYTQFLSSVSPVSKYCTVTFGN